MFIEQAFDKQSKSVVDGSEPLDGFKFGKGGHQMDGGNDFSSFGPDSVEDMVPAYEGYKRSFQNFGKGCSSAQPDANSTERGNCMDDMDQDANLMGIRCGLGDRNKWI